MIIRKCISTTNFNDFVSVFESDLYSTGIFSTIESPVDEHYIHIKLYYTTDEYVELLIPINSDMLSVRVGGASDSGFATDMYDISGNYISYTIVATSAGSLALAMKAITTNTEEERYTNDLQLYITSVSGVKVAITADYAMYNSAVYYPDLIFTSSGSAMDWVQLVPFGSPELGGVSNEVYMIRYTPTTCTEITVGTQAYIFGERLAIVLEAEND